MAERHKISVAVALENTDPMNYDFLAGGLFMVTKRETGLLGLPAGHLELEVPFNAAIRELREETGLNQADVRLRENPIIHAIVSENQVSVGILYSGKTRKCIPHNGYAMGPGEISFVRPFQIGELIELVNNPEKLYKPAFNRAFISTILLQYLDSMHSFRSAQLEAARSWGIPEEYLNSSF